MNKIVLPIILIALFIVPFSSAAATINVNPNNPGVAEQQDALLSRTLAWTIQPPTALISSLCSQTETLNRSSLDMLSRRSSTYAYLPLSGLNSSQTGLNSIGKMVFTSETPVKTTSDLPPASPQCPSSITPGIISLVAQKNNPSNPVVVNQDPARTGVDLTWVVNVLPTVYTYGLWEPIIPEDGHCKSLNAECIINNSGKACCAGLKCVPKNPHSGNGKCEIDPNAVVYGCVDHTLTFREEIATLTPKASLTEASRNWILGPLAKAYPGSRLQHPDWSFTATHPCVWEGDSCVWTHIQSHVPVVDPGYYDLLIEGTTLGTDITEPRNFVLYSGQFGVYLMETTKSG